MSAPEHPLSYTKSWKVRRVDDGGDETAKILITPEYVRKLSGDFRAAANENLARINSLNTQMEDLRAQWEGASREKFYADFEKAKATMNAYSPLLEGIGTELSQIGQRFAEADQQARAQTQATSSAQASASDQQAASQTDSTMQAPAENVADITAASPTQESAPDQQATSQADSTTQAMDQAQTDASTPAPDQAASTAPAPDQAASPLPEQAQTDTYLTLRGPQLDGKDTYIQITQAEYDQWATLPTEDQTSFLNNLPPERIMVLSSEDTATVATTLDQAMADSTTPESDQAADYLTFRGPRLDDSETRIQITQAELDQWQTLGTPEEQLAFLGNLPPERITKVPFGTWDITPE